MVQETIKYKDYNGVEREETFRFDLSEAEVTELLYSAEGGLDKYYERIIAAKDDNAAMKEFKKLLLLAYGEKSADGRRFVKSPELSKAFSETPAYSILYMRMARDPEYAAKFFNGIVPTSSGAAPVTSVNA